MINFYCPSRFIVESVPNSIDDYWRWINNVIDEQPAKLPTGVLCKWHGPYGWTVQTFIHLRNAGIDCNLVSEIPREGITLAHSDFWPPNLRPSRLQFFVEIKPDRDKQLASAQFTIVQSPHDALLLDDVGKTVAYISYWPQPSLMHRDPRRGTLIERAAFIGNPESFITKPKSLTSHLSKMGVSFSMPRRVAWNDYTEVDIVIAVREKTTFHRSTSGRPRVRDSHRFVGRKPPNKLVNAWLAGVPAILSPDPSFQDARRSHLDFIEAEDLEQIVAAVKMLKGDSELYRTMANNGRLRAREYDADAVVAQWRELMDHSIKPAYFEWRAAGRSKWFGWLSRHA
jgi:hypothetical protein